MKGLINIISHIVSKNSLAFRYKVENMILKQEDFFLISQLLKTKAYGIIIRPMHPNIEFQNLNHSWMHCLIALSQAAPPWIWTIHSNQMD